MIWKSAITCLACFALVACGPADQGTPVPEKEKSAKPLVIASNYPLFYFAQRIAGDSVTVGIPDFNGDPAFWKPDAEQTRDLQQADLLLLNGAGYESWRDWVTLSQDSLLDTSRGFRDRLFTTNDAPVHQHGPAGEHSHGELAFTTWLDPLLAAEQAAAAKGGLDRLLPQHEPEFRERLQELTDQLQELDRELGEALQVLGDQPVIFSHPVYQYLAGRYGLDGASVHWEPDREPGTGDWIELQRLLQRHPARFMLWEGAPLESVAKRLRELGVEPVVFHTLALPPAQGDYFDGMKANIQRLQLRGKSPTTLPSSSSSG